MDPSTELFFQALSVAARQWPEWQWSVQELSTMSVLYVYAAVPGLPEPVRGGITRELLAGAPLVEHARIAVKIVHGIVLEVAERRRVQAEKIAAGMKAAPSAAPFYTVKLSSDSYLFQQAVAKVLTLADISKAST